MRLMAALGLAVLGLGFVPASALALTCMFRPFQAPGERCGTAAPLGSSRYAAPSSKSRAASPWATSET
jgi:hypothetical protein